MIGLVTGLVTGLGRVKRTAIVAGLAIAGFAVFVWRIRSAAARAALAKERAEREKEVRDAEKRMDDVDRASSDDVSGSLFDDKF